MTLVTSGITIYIYLVITPFSYLKLQSQSGSRFNGRRIGHRSRRRRDSDKRVVILPELSHEKKGVLVTVLIHFIIYIPGTRREGHPSTGRGRTEKGHWFLGERELPRVRERM